MKFSRITGFEVLQYGPFLPTCPRISRRAQSGYNFGTPLSPGKFNRANKKIEKTRDQHSPTVKTEEQKLSEELLVNDSLGG